MSNAQDANLAYLTILQGVVGSSIASSSGTTATQRRHHEGIVAMDGSSDGSPSTRKRRRTAVKKRRTTASTKDTNSSKNGPSLIMAGEFVAEDAAAVVGSQATKTLDGSLVEVRLEVPSASPTSNSSSKGWNIQGNHNTASAIVGHLSKCNDVVTNETGEFRDESPTLDDAVAAAVLKSLIQAPTIGMKSDKSSIVSSKSTASKSTSAAAATAKTTRAIPSMITEDELFTGKVVLTTASANPSNPSTITTTAGVTEAGTADFTPNYNDTDVLLGKGGLSNNHPGNKMYVAKALSMQEMYKNVPMPEKTKMSRDLVQFVHDRGGRFMVKPKDSNDWVEVDFTTARKKASRLLRGDSRRNPEDGTYTVKQAEARALQVETGPSDGVGAGGSSLGSNTTATPTTKAWTNVVLPKQDNLETVGGEVFKSRVYFQDGNHTWNVAAPASKENKDSPRDGDVGVGGMSSESQNGNAHGRGEDRESLGSALKPFPLHSDERPTADGVVEYENFQ